MIRGRYEGNTYPSISIFSGVVRLDGLGLNDDTGVASLVVLALVRDGPDYIARSEECTGGDDGHK